MDERDKEKFAGLIEGLALVFKTKISKPFLQAYWLGLKDLSYDDVEMAAARALSACGFMPVPKDLRDLAGAMGASQKAIIAWNAVKQAIREHGSYRSVDFDDPAVNAVIRSLGGWPRVCGTDSEELDRWVSREFQRLYRELSALPLGQDLTRYLPGLHESSGAQTLGEAPKQVAAGTGAARPPTQQLQAADPAERKRLQDLAGETAKALSEWKPGLAGGRT